ncbi:MAG: hypothetical protein OWT28_05120 [Firmicutes bacterium]|nr:hypothetical protein [Bacillota bacterium]
MSHAAMQSIVYTMHQSVAANAAYFHLWVANVLWTWQWWSQLVLSVVSFVAWMIWRKKSSAGRLLLAGLFVLPVAVWLDFIGNLSGLWYYPYELIPTIPSFAPWDVAIPIEAMGMLQIKPRLSPWIKGIVFGGVNSFILEPLSTMLGLYVPVHWHYAYSFPIYLLIFIGADRMARIDQFASLDEK